MRKNNRDTSGNTLEDSSMGITPQHGHFDGINREFPQPNRGSVYRTDGQGAMRRKKSYATMTQQHLIQCFWRIKSLRWINKVERKRRFLMGLGLLVAWIFVRYVLMPLPSYQSTQEQNLRPYRFPTIEQRVKLYMSSWYDPPSIKRAGFSTDFQDFVVLYYWHSLSPTGDQVLQVTELPWRNGTKARTFDIRKTVEVSTIFYYDSDSLSVCGKRRWPVGPYCLDIMSSIQTAENGPRRSGNGQNNPPPTTPILLQFGDEDLSRAYQANHRTTETKQALLPDPRIPHIKKFRQALHTKVLQGLMSTAKNSASKIQPFTNWTDSPLHPIIWKLNVKRHFRDLYLVPRYDRAWTNKLDKVIFRGALTGRSGKDRIEPAVGGGPDIEARRRQYCDTLPRCRLVYKYARSEMIDAKLTKLLEDYHGIPEQIDGTQLLGKTMSQWEMLRYKGIIILEGNDVSSGLKWAMLSQSVVLMPPPTYTSWAMEELLEPWIHYIPLQEDLSDVEDKVRWMQQHDAEAQRISHRASLWIKDLVFHPDALADEIAINKDILRRYRTHFIKAKSAEYN